MKKYPLLAMTLLVALVASACATDTGASGSAASSAEPASSPAISQEMKDKALVETMPEQFAVYRQVLEGLKDIQTQAQAGTLDKEAALNRIKASHGINTFVKPIAGNDPKAVEFPSLTKDQQEVFTPFYEKMVNSAKDLMALAQDTQSALEEEKGDWPALISRSDQLLAQAKADEEALRDAYAQSGLEPLPTNDQ
ncbi:hypothetical protein ACKQTC_07910 [Peptococcus simiae]|uniref:DUF4142 domain-containing protein n=1 Tax=Peptococcus simiae TaxID=1643805 RepID=A0ABW9H0B1_9FIRM